MLPAEDIAALEHGAPIETEDLTTGAAATYSSLVFDVGEVVRLTGLTSTHRVKFVEEYVFNPTLGNTWFENPLVTWATDAEDSLLSLNHWRPPSPPTTLATVTLDKTRAAIAKNYVMEFLLTNGTGDAIRSPLTKYGPEVRSYHPNNFLFPASKVLELEIRHRETDALAFLEYQLRREITVPVYWNGTIWTTETWIDVTGSATEASFTSAITLDAAPSTYTLALRPNAADAGDISRVSRVSVHETILAAEGTPLAINGSVVMITPFRCRVAAIAGGAASLVIERLGAQKFA